MPRHSRALLIVLAGVLALGMAGPPMAADLPKADRVLVLKAAHRLELLKDGGVIKSYPIALGRHPVGPKRRRGDGRTPEGIYTIDRHLPHSLYHRALHISYPNAADRARARAAGVHPGGGIVVHGMPEPAGRRDPDRFFRDWTNGCISVGNTAIDEITAAVDDGTPIEIRP